MLTSLKIKALKSKDFPYRMADVGGCCKGMCVRVSTQGHKSFVLSTRRKGIRKSYKIGDVSDISLLDARQAGLKLREQIEEGYL